MKLFPSKKFYLKLIDDQLTTRRRLKESTKKSHRFNLSNTNKPFLGIIDVDYFKLTCPQSNFGILCILSGKIDANEIHVFIKFRRVTKIVMIIVLCIFTAEFLIDVITKPDEIFSEFTLASLVFVLILRFIVYKMLFIIASRKCLQIVRDILKTEEFSVK